MKIVLNVKANDGRAQVSGKLTVSLVGLSRSETDRVKTQLAENVMNALRGLSYTAFSIRNTRLS